MLTSGVLHESIDVSRRSQANDVEQAASPETPPCVDLLLPLTGLQLRLTALFIPAAGAHCDTGVQMPIKNRMQYGHQSDEAGMDFK